MRVITDFHHSSLLRSLVLLFQDRLEMEVYRPIGMEWFDEGYWAINKQLDTAEQFLKYESQPIDNTSPLNSILEKELMGVDDGIYEILDPGDMTTHYACTLKFFKENQFDYVIASIPAHVPIFKELIRKYQPKAKLIIQMGNNWDIDQYAGENVLTSIKPRQTRANAMFYHQEFDLDIFKPSPVPTQPANRKIYSFVNVIQNHNRAWHDYMLLKGRAENEGYKVRAYGGQCPDGNMTGPKELANKMREAMFIFHVKDGGDGFGHIIHNAYAVGRPIITRSSDYRGQLAEDLLTHGTYIDLDQYNTNEAMAVINNYYQNPELLVNMGRKASDRFKEIVNYKKEAEDIKQWLNELS